MADSAGSQRRPSTAVVLAGGGALGAYEAGVLHYVLDGLHRDTALAEPARFDLFCGTSVGALNAAFLAAAAHRPAHSGRDLAEFWESVTFDKILRFGAGELATALRLVSGAAPGRFWPQRPKWGKGSARPRRAPHEPVAGLFDTTPLYELMGGRIPWHTLAENIRTDVVQGIALCATEVCSGRSIIFYQSSDSTRYRPGRDPTKQARQVQMRVDHAMASAAIPFLFPSVQVNGTCYTDGALRQNTPLNPALRFGADRVLVVSISQEPETASRIARVGCRRNPYPGALFLLGKTVAILVTQSLDYELKRVEMYNRLLSGGEEIYGPGFAGNLNAIMGSPRNATFRPVRTCHIRPSESLHQLALGALQEAPKELALPGVPGKVLSRFFRSTAFAESELLRFLMFTPSFIRAQLQLGYRDALARRDELAAFFAP